MAFFQAQHLNYQSGGAVVAPWDILPGYELTDWIEAAMRLNDVPALRSRRKAQDEYLMKWRRSHKDYAKRHRLIH